MKKLFAIIAAVVLLFSLASCAPKDASKAEEKLEKKGYSVVVDENLIPAALKLAGIDVDAVVTAVKDIEDADDEFVTAYLFSSKDDAKAAIEKLSEWAEKKNEESNFKQSGCWLYAGSDKGMKDFN